VGNAATPNPRPAAVFRPHRILVRGVNWLGDAVMATPALLRLREANPDAHITLLTHTKLADLWRHHPAVDAVAAFSARDTVWSVARRLHAGNFHVGLALPNSPRSAFELWLARVPRRVGYTGPLRNWFLTERVPPRAGRVPMRKRPVDEIRRQAAGGPGAASDSTLRASPPHTAHHIHQYLHLVAALGASAEPLPPYLEVTREEIVAARKRFFLAGDVPWSGLNPGAEYGPAKRWPPERFIAAATQTQKTTRGRWLIFGGPSDVQLATQLSESLTRDFPSAPPLNLAGKTSLRELCALLKLCRVLLTNDTGPMHVAAAVGTPVVAVFGSTSPELTGPGLPGDSLHHLLKSDAACSPCFRRECPIDFRCMRGIEVERVVKAMLEVLERNH
jgi:heptosyltransferase-2